MPSASYKKRLATALAAAALASALAVSGAHAHMAPNPCLAVRHRVLDRGLAADEYEKLRAPAPTRPGCATGVLDRGLRRRGVSGSALSRNRGPGQRPARRRRSSRWSTSRPASTPCRPSSERSPRPRCRSC